MLQVVEEALVLLDKLGEQYEQEHAKDLKDTVYYLPHEVRRPGCVKGCVLRSKDGCEGVCVGTRGCPNRCMPHACVHTCTHRCAGMVACT